MVDGINSLMCGDNSGFYLDKATGSLCVISEPTKQVLSFRKLQVCEMLQSVDLCLYVQHNLQETVNGG